MENFYKKLEKILKQDDAFISAEGKLVKSEIINRAYKIDETLISLLLQDKDMRGKFFKDIKGNLVFDSFLFTEYIQDKNFLNDSYTKFGNKIGLTIDGKSLNERGEVALAWPFKDCVLEGGMNDGEAKRKEIFFNELLAEDEINRLYERKVFTNGKKYNAKGAKSFDNFNRKNGTIKDNLVIKGNNLFTLHSLYKEFSGKVKLVYIDPPYNTGSDSDTFVYNNGFNHSTWLTFMKNRLEIAKDLLRADGFIAITIDHAELFYLGVIADEVFGKENRIGIVTIVHKPEGRNQAKFFSASNEFMIVYAKDKDVATLQRVVLSDSKKQEFTETDDNGNFKWKSFLRSDVKRSEKPKQFYPIYVSQNLKNITLEKKDGYYEVIPVKGETERGWILLSSSFSNALQTKNIRAINKNGNIEIEFKLREQEVYVTHWVDKRYNATAHGTNLLRKLIGDDAKFSFPKSVYSTLDAIKIMTSEDDIVVDFFGGSGTTAHAVLEANEEDDGKRQFIIVEQMDYIEKVTKKRIRAVIKQKMRGEFIYFELKKYNEKFVDDIIAAQDSKELIKIWESMKEKSFLKYNIDFRKIDYAFAEWELLDMAQQKKAFISLLDKNHLYVNYSSMNDKEFSCTASEKKLTKDFYGVK